MLDPEAIYFPEPEAIPGFAMEFMRMMSAHANFEMEVRLLQDTITRKPDNKQSDRKTDGSLGSARDRPKRMAKLIKQHLGAIPEAGQIKKILTEAIGPCDDRNLLAHGQWWRFDSKTSTIKIHGERKGQIKFADFAEANILKIADDLKGLKTELFKLRSAIENRRGDHDVDECDLVT
jgi:hypothetical protein